MWFILSKLNSYLLIYIYLWYKFFMKNKFNLILSIFFIFLGLIFTAYDFVLIIIFPGTFFDNLFSFSHIWLIPGIFFITEGIFRLKKKHSVLKLISKKVLIPISGFILICLIISVICLYFIITPEQTYAQDSDFIFILGGGIDKNGNLSSAVINRLDIACKYLKESKNTIAVVTGGRVDFLPYPEAPEMKNYLIKNGIDKDRILCESKSQDTIQNFIYSLNLTSQTFNKSLSDILQSRIIVVTSDFHLARALRIAKRIGFTNVTGLCAKTPLILIPNLYVREIAAYIKLNLRILLTGNPRKINQL